MKHGPSRILPLVLVAVFAALPATAQLQGFGQNKISYETFDWKVYESPHFDVHYYASVEPFLEDVVSHAESAYVKLSRDLDHELKFRVPLVIYKTHGEFQQTNITLSELPEGVAAFAEPVQYRMVLPIDDPPDKLYKLIAHELTHIFEYSMFFEGSFARAIRARPPTWLMEGLASYMAQDEDNLDKMVIRDAVVNNILPPLQALNVLSFLTYRYGNAVFDYIVQEHGIEGLRTFLFEFKKVMLTANIGKAIKESFGYDIDEFNRRFNRYLRRKYFPVLLEKKSPDEYGTELGVQRSSFTASPTLSPSGELIAAIAVPKQEVDLVILSAEDGSLIKNVTKGWTNDYRNLVTEAFKGKRDLSWSPLKDEVAAFVRVENRWHLYVVNGLTGKKVREVVFDDIFQAASPAFSPDGRKIAFVGNQNGVFDVFEVALETGEVRNLTQDDFHDANPWYSTDGQTLLYNRRLGEHWKIFSVDVNDPSKKTQLTFGAFSDIQPSYSRDGTTIFFSSDRNQYGVFNIYSLSLETGDVWQYTDVVGGCFSPAEMAPRSGEPHLVFAAFFEGAFRTYRMPLRSPELKIAAEDRMGDPVEAEPFEPTLQLRADEDKKKKYKVRWDFEPPDFTIGISNDGTILTQGALQFADLLGDQRIFINFASVADFVQYSGTYLNYKRRFTWGGTLFDFRDYFVDNRTGQRLRRTNKITGGRAILQYPLNRFYRVDASASLMQTAYDRASLDPTTGMVFFPRTEDEWASLRTGLVGDTTRWSSFGPFQGKRFTVGGGYNFHLGGDSPGDQYDAHVDFRTYKQVTRRSVLAWRLAGNWFVGANGNEPSLGFGGINQLRGWDFREFFGSRIAWSNLEFRFPLVDRLSFPILTLVQIRGFFFLDVGAAWYENFWYDPEIPVITTDAAGGVSSRLQSAFRNDPQTGQPIPFSFWDSENNRLQDGRAAYGMGFQFFFAGLQFNWVWAKRMPYTQYVLNVTPTESFFTTEERKGDGFRNEFYIAFDW